MAGGRSVYLKATLFIERVVALCYFLAIENLFKLTVLTTTVCNNVWCQLSLDLTLSGGLFLRLTAGKAAITLFLLMLLLHLGILILLFLFVVRDCRVSSKLFAGGSAPVLAEVKLTLRF